MGIWIPFDRIAALMVGELEELGIWVLTQRNQPDPRFDFKTLVSGVPFYVRQSFDRGIPFFTILIDIMYSRRCA